MTAKATPKEASLGVFGFAKETPNTHRFEQAVEGGRAKLQYVSKDILEGLGNPEKVEVIIRGA